MRLTFLKYNIYIYTLIIDNYLQAICVKNIKGRYLNFKPVLLGTRFFKIDPFTMWRPSVYNWSYTGKCGYIVFRMSEIWGIRPFADRTLSARDLQKVVYGLYGCSTDRAYSTRSHKGRIGIAYNTGCYESLAVTRESMGIDRNCDLGFCDWICSQIIWNYKVQKPYQCHLNCNCDCLLHVFL